MPPETPEQTAASSDDIGGRQGHIRRARDFLKKEGHWGRVKGDVVDASAIRQTLR